MDDRIYDRLLRAKESGTAAHCYLFTGEKGSGKKDTALKFASELLDASEEHLRAHPDFFILERNDDEDGKEISIDGVRELKKRFSLTSALGGWKIAIVEGAELLSGEAATALLKLLESPEGQALIIMTAGRYGAVMPTIRSRAVRVPFPTPVSGEKAYTEEEETELKKLFGEVLKMPYALRFKAAERYAKSAKGRETLVRWAADAFHKDLLACGQDRSALQKCRTRIRSLIRTETLLAYTNASPRLLLDVFLMNL